MGDREKGQGKEEWVEVKRKLGRLRRGKEGRGKEKKGRFTGQGKF